MDDYFAEENLDEIPVYTRFLLGSDNESSHHEVEWVADDPLSIDQDPLEISPVLPVVVKAVSHRKNQRGLPSVPQKQVPTTAKATPKTPQIPSQSRPAPPPAVKSLIPPKYRNMSHADFIKEMEQSIDDIVTEAIAVIGKDPKEYHPVYLRIFKYITIGHQLGYIVGDTKKIWKGFLNFAERQFKRSLKTPMLFKGERSAYATYLLAKKLEDGVAVPKRTESERRRIFRELEGKAKRIRDEWNLKAKSGDNIQEDLETRLKFFNECKMITHPVDCIKMNNLWAKFLSEEGFSTRKMGKATKKKTIDDNDGSDPEVVEVPVESSADVEVKEEPCQSLRRFIVKVIVAPPASSLSSTPANEPSINVPTLPMSPEPQNASDPPSPCHSPAPPSPPRSPSPVIEKVASPSKKRKSAPEHSNDSETPPVKLSRTPERRPLKKQTKLGLARRKVLLKKNFSQIAKKPLISSNILLKKRKLMGNAASTSKESVLARQLKLEKMLNQPTKLLLAKKKKKIQKKVGPQESECSKEVDTKEKLAKEPSPCKPKIKKKISLKKTAIKPNSKTNQPSASSVLLKNRKKRNAITQLQKKGKEELQIRVEKMIDRKSRNIKHKKEKKVLSREEILARKARCRETWNHYGRFRKFRTCCPICEEPLTIGTLGKHIKKIHEIIEDGDLWTCPVPGCKIRNLTHRDTWLGHIDSKHKGKVNMDELMEMAQRVNTKVDWKTLEVKFPQGRTFRLDKPQGHGLPGRKGGRVKPKVQNQTQPNPTFERVTEISRSGKDGRARQACDECGQWYCIRYLPVHKDIVHNPDRHRSVCPICSKSFNYSSNLWHHYCDKHLSTSLDFLDPIPLERRLGQLRVSSKRGRKRLDQSSTCELCGKTFSAPLGRRRHMLQIHGQGEAQTFPCPQCPKTYKVKDVLDTHIRTDHEGVGTCRHCGRKHQSKGKLWRHLMDVHHLSASEAAAESNVSFLPCPYCGEELLQGRQINSHVKAQHPENFEEFNLSNIQLSLPNTPLPNSELVLSNNERRKLLKREMRRRFREEGIGPAWIAREQSYAPAEKFPCPECGKEYHRKRLYFHRKSVHGIIGDLSTSGTVTCPVEGCTLMLNSEKNMRRHARITHIDHIKDKIIEKKVLKIVEETELYTTHLCILCNTYHYSMMEAFVHIAAKHPHVFSDTNVNSEPAPFTAPLPAPSQPPPPLPEYPCPHCQSKFPSDEEMRGHVEMSHPEMCWRCPECSKLMVGPDDLEKHFEEGHNENEGGKPTETTEPTPQRSETEDIQQNQEKKDGVFMTARSKSRRKYLYGGLKGRDNMRNKNEEESTTFEADKAELENIMVKCEICKEELPVGKLSVHLIRIHGVMEEPLECSVCEVRRVFKDAKFGRTYWMYHMRQFHQESFSMESVVEVVSKVHTSVDWRTLEIRNPSGAVETSNSITVLVNTDTDEEVEKVETKKKSSRTLKRPLKPKVRLSGSINTKTERKKKQKSSSSEDEEEDSDSDMEKEDAWGKEIETAPPRRTSRLSARKAVNQIKKFVEQEKRGDDDMGQYETTDSYTKPEVKSKKRFPRMVIGAGLGKRVPRKAESINPLRNKISGDIENIEKEKRLVIKLFRLTKNELKMYERKTGQSEEHLDNSVIKKEKQDGGGEDNSADGSDIL